MKIEVGERAEAESLLNGLLEALRGNPDWYSEEREAATVALLEQVRQKVCLHCGKPLELFNESEGPSRWWYIHFYTGKYTCFDTALSTFAQPKE
jgi:hypothetical protein